MSHAATLSRSHPRSKSKPYPYGLLRKVARSLGVHESLVSRVSRGKATSARVSKAIQEALGK